MVGSTLAPMYRSRYPVHVVAVDVKSTRTIVDRAFSVPKCVRLERNFISYCARCSRQSRRELRRS